MHFYVGSKLRHLLFADILFEELTDGLFPDYK